MESAVAEWLLKLWQEWDVRSFVLISLLLQSILIFLAPLRKRMPHKRLFIFIWSAYLVSDWVASFALGLISNTLRETSKTPSSKITQDLLAFWAPFLLLHLGGPDTITAFALEDNELWVRHLLGLFLQLLAAAYIFFRSLPDNKLWIPTCLMFVVGVIKYGERNQALYQASTRCLRNSMRNKPDPGLNYTMLMDRFTWMKECGVPVKIQNAKEPKLNTRSITEGLQRHYLNDILLVETAYDFFNISKGLIVDYVFTSYEREETRRFFLKIEKAEEAFRLVEVELNFIYDLFYTKTYVAHHGLAYLLRVIGFSSTLMAMFLFLYSNKDQMHRIDVQVTYALLLGAISLEVVALFMLISSDWTILLLKNSSDCVKSVFYKITINSFFKKPRWSGSISQFHLVRSYLRKHVDIVTNYLGLENFLDEIQNKYRKPLSPSLKVFIFEELKKKSEIAETLEIAKQISSSRGDYILRKYPQFSWSFEVDFDESILLWHIATNLLYYKGDGCTGSFFVGNHREFCKVLSDYMLYLLVMQPTIIPSAVTSTARRRYQDTRAVAEKFFDDLEHESLSPKEALKFMCGFKSEVTQDQVKEAYRKLYDVDRIMLPAHMEGNKSNSVLFDAVRLAKDLRELKVEKWKIISEMWVELLCYAASHCKVNAHIKQVSKGGELVTLVWLLMLRFGLGEQFAVDKGNHRLIIVVEK